MLLREYSSTDYVNTHCLFNSGDVIGGKAWTSIVVLLRCKSGTTLPWKFKPLLGNAAMLEDDVDAAAVSRAQQLLPPCRRRRQK